MATFCSEMLENQEMMASMLKEDHKWSGKKMEGDESLNTVESLRGRLLAERQCSRLAKQEAESMGHKLVELENKLREEVKLRGKAERKLKFLNRKLESLNINISSISGELGESYSSEKCENSCRSSTCSSASRTPDKNETKPQVKKPAESENSMHIVSEASSSISKDYIAQVNNDFSSNSILDHPSRNLHQNPNPSHEDSKNDENRFSCSSSKSSAEDSISRCTDDSCSNLNQNHSSIANPCLNSNPSSQEVTSNESSRFLCLSSKSSATENEADDGDFVDNSLALVPVDLPISTQVETSNSKPADQSVIEVLNALRLAKEKLLGSMGTRQMIRV